MRGARAPAYRVAAAVALIASAASVTQSLAQESRRETIERTQAEKARHLEPYEASRAERIVEALERYVQRDHGFFPAFDSVYAGGGLTAGASYRAAYGSQAIWEARGLYSIRSYKLVEPATVSPGHAGAPLALSLRSGWRDATQVAFCGVGNDTSAEAPTHYRLHEAYAMGAGTWRLNSWSTIGGGLSYENFALKRDQGSVPSIEERYAPGTALARGRCAAVSRTKGLRRSRTGRLNGSGVSPRHLA